MTITYAVGDATDPPQRPVIVAHVVNDVGVFGAGFALAVAKRWPVAREDYRRWHAHGSNFTLGGTRLTRVDGQLWVMHLLAQHGIGRGAVRIRYDALGECLRALAKEAKTLDAAVAMPRIGSGLAGGDWTRIEALIAEACADVDVTVYDLPTEGARP